MNDYTVYMHVNKINGMRYIGLTCQSVAVRWQAGGNGYRKQSHFWRAIKKYGWDNFKHVIIAEELSREEACALEVELIKRYQTTDNTKGYNKSTGGDAGGRGVVKSKKARATASKCLSDLWKDPVFRKEAVQRTIDMNKSEAIRKKKSASNKGRVLSQASRDKISRAKQGKSLGPFSKEHIARMKANHAGGADKVAVICIDTNEHFQSINDAARAKGINKKGISGCCRKMPHYNTAGGYRWRFANGD